LVCFALGAFLLVALVAYEPAQSAFHTTGPTLKNPAGKYGANTVWAMLYTVGISTWLVPFFLLWMLFVSVRNSKHLNGTSQVLIPTV